MYASTVICSGCKKHSSLVEKTISKPGDNPRTRRRFVKSLWCNKCRLVKPSEIHHIVPQCYFHRKEIPVDNRETNLADLCSHCHFDVPDLEDYEEIYLWENYLKRPAIPIYNFIIGIWFALESSLSNTEEDTKTKIDKTFDLIKMYFESARLKYAIVDLIPFDMSDITPEYIKNLISSSVRLTPTERTYLQIS